MRDRTALIGSLAVVCLLSGAVPFAQNIPPKSLEGQFPGAPDYLGGSKYAGAPGFSNDLAINRTTVTIKKRGDLLQVFVGTTKVAEYAKGVPAAMQFDSLYFELGSSADEKMFLGNIRITKN